MENFDNVDFNLEEIIGEVEDLEETIRGQRRLTGLHMPHEEDDLPQSPRREKRRRDVMASPSSPSSPPHQRVRRTSYDPPPGVLVDEFGLPLPSPQDEVGSWANNPRQILSRSSLGSPPAHTSQDDLYHIQLGPQLHTRRSDGSPSLAATGMVIYLDCSVVKCTVLN